MTLGASAHVRFATQTAESWAETLEMAVAADPDHVSCYDLQLEDSTPFARWYTRGEPPAIRAHSRGPFQDGVAGAQGAGYSHYEISNYAREGHECRHNLACWRTTRSTPLALGPPPACTAGGSRPKKLCGTSNGSGEAGRSVCRWSGALREDEDERLDLIMLSLR